MAKGSLFVGSGSGKVGNLVLANTKSGQITRAYQPNVANPKTRGQMLQRARFANAVKFFKQATNGFFKFAYEDKAKKESDYNAYMRHNIKVSLPISRELYESVPMPAMGDVFVMSAGRLSNPIGVSFAAKSTPVDGAAADDLTLTLPSKAAASTIGAVSAVLVSAGLQVGDIITIVRVGADVTLDDVKDISQLEDNGKAPEWTIYQFVVNPDDNTDLAQCPAIGHDTADGVRALTADEGLTKLTAVFADGKSQWGCVVITRKTDSTLYASNSYLVGDSMAESIKSYLTGTNVVEDSLLSWGSKGQVILKGSIASK